MVPERLYLLQLAATTIQVRSGSLDMSSGCYLVRMSDGTNVLIDSGQPDDFKLPPGANSTVEAKLAHLLAKIGVTPSDISVVVCTHFDIDHVGHHQDFDGAEFVVQKRHYELALSGNERFASGKKHWGHRGLRYRLVDGDVDLYPGFRLIETSGHTTGHQSVLLRLPETGLVLLAIDAVMLQRLFVRDRTATPADENADELRASTVKLLDLVSELGVRLIVFGHDGAQWRNLRVAPSFYA
ncbi:MAG TPA: N-acyl homoserine lactonase family protein [Candidatus Udaeobacter sp.]|nr:N-acyl homoserine lactonase family protein [Candidatus Udaeobacter sp.]